jgi:hypothetical protein
MYMRTAFLLLTILCTLLAPSVRAAEVREIVLGPQDRYEVAETSQWDVEVMKEASGQFADVRVKPKRGTAFVLTLYFLGDPPDLARLDTREKIAESVKSNAERFLGMTVEKSITLQAVAPRGSYGSIAVLTAASVKGDPDEFKYQTRGMVRLSPDAALGFGLLSKEINTPAYRQLLAYVYSFIKLAPTFAAEPATRPAPAAAPVVAVPAPTPKPLPAPAAVAAPAQPPARVAVEPTPAPAPVATPAPVARPEPVASPAPMPARAPAAQEPVVVPAPAPAAVRPAAPAPAPRPAPSGRGQQQDMRECLKLPTDAEIMRCASGRK